MSAGKLRYTLIVRHPETDAPTALLAGEPVPAWAKDLVHADDLESGKAAAGSGDNSDADAAKAAEEAEAAAKAAADAEAVAKEAAEKAAAVEAEAKAKADEEAAAAAAAGHPVGDPVVGWKGDELDAYAKAKGYDLGEAKTKQEKVDAITAAAAAAGSGDN